MRKTLVIAVREYRAAVRTKAFIISLVLMPVLFGGSVVVQLLLRDKVDTKDKHIAILDRTPKSLLFDAVAESARMRNEEEIFTSGAKDRKQIKPRFLLERVSLDEGDLQHAVLKLSDRVREKELFAFVVIDPQAADPPASPAVSDGRTSSTPVRYYSNSPTYEDAPRWLSSVLNMQIQKMRLVAAHIDPDVVLRATRPVSVTNLGLVSLDEEGNVVEARETNRLANVMLPFAMMMLMFMIVLIGASPLVQSVLEEKMQRIAEVLLGSVTPFQLMSGKLIGMVGISLTMATIYLVGGYFALGKLGYGRLFPTHLIWWFVAFLGLAVVMYGSLFAAIGAAVTDMKEAQSLMTPITILVVSPMFVWLPVLKEPSAAFSVALSLVPPATPMLMTIRLAVPPGVPVWQPVLGMVLVLLTTAALMFAAGRIFRVGILMQGRGARLGEMIRWIIRG